MKQARVSDQMTRVLIVQSPISAATNPSNCAISNGCNVFLHGMLCAAAKQVNVRLNI